MSDRIAARRPPLRVLHLQNGSKFGGIQRMLVCLAEERAACPEMEPIFALCYAERLATELLAAGARVEILGPVSGRKPWQIFRGQFRLWRLLTRERFDVVVCHGSWPLALFGVVPRLLGIPLVLWMHNDTPRRNKNPLEFLAGRIGPDWVICNSAFTAASLPLLFPKPPPHSVVACPVSKPAQSFRSAAARALVREQCATPEESVVIILVGRPEAWKGHAILLQALGELRTLPGWTCWFVGGAFDSSQTAFLEQLKSAAETAGIAERVRFLGQRQDAPALLAAADVFCQPNLSPEPFGIVFIEALYAGLPVVATDHGGAREIVDQTSGRLVPPGDASALAAALKTLITQPELRASLSQAAPSRGAAISDPAHLLPAISEIFVGLRQPARLHG